MHVRNGSEALLSDFVEMQAPLFDGAFVHWFMNRLGKSIGGMNIAQGHGWGVDNVWCGAAVAFANGTDRPHCAVIPVAVTHHDTRSLPRGRSAEQRGLRAVALTCLLAQQAAGGRAGGAFEGRGRWASDPKQTGWYGPNGYAALPDGEANGYMATRAKLRAKLLAEASYGTGIECCAGELSRRSARAGAACHSGRTTTSSNVHPISAL